MKERLAVKKPGNMVITGFGPAGHSSTGELAQAGKDVTLFESFQIFSGVLIFGIPEFRS
jgi:NADPH-dependent glutamate synthase beta subunit-like oxidoreductase